MTIKKPPLVFHRTPAVVLRYMGYFCELSIAACTCFR